MANLTPKTHHAAWFTQPDGTPGTTVNSSITAQTSNVTTTRLMSSASVTPMTDETMAVPSEEKAAEIAPSTSSSGQVAPVPYAESAKLFYQRIATDVLFAPDDESLGRRFECAAPMPSLRAGHTAFSMNGISTGFGMQGTSRDLQLWVCEFTDRLAQHLIHCTLHPPTIDAELEDAASTFFQETETKGFYPPMAFAAIRQQLDGGFNK